MPSPQRYTDARRIQKQGHVQTTESNLSRVEEITAAAHRTANKLASETNSSLTTNPATYGIWQEHTNKNRAVGSIKGRNLFQEHRRVLEFDKRPHSDGGLRMWERKICRYVFASCLAAESMMRFSHGDREETRLPLLCTWRAPWSLWPTKQSPSSPFQMSSLSHYLSIIFTFTKMPLYLTPLTASLFLNFKIHRSGLVFSFQYNNNNYYLNYLRILIINKN